MTQFERNVIESLSRIEEQNKTQFKRIEAIEKAVNGNGQPGLLSRVAALELNWRWVKYLAGVVGAGIGYVFAHLTKN